MTTAEAGRRHQILALTGGGFRGVFTTAFLAHCEQAWSFDWRERFQLFAGTSVGALLAAGLAAGKTADELRTAMQVHGALIFRKKPLSGPRRLFGSAPYATQPLRAAAEAVLGEKKDVLLSDFDGKLLIVAVNYSRGAAELFTSKGLAGADASRIKLVDAVLASAAAPTYFPMVQLGRHEYADGGLIANAPDVAALIESLSRQNAPLDKTYMLSLGTASPNQGVVLRQTPDDPGILRALWNRRLVQTTMAAQENLAMHQIGILLRQRHLRIDHEPDAERAKEIGDLDNATSESFQALN